jgi:hypothetical protein
MLTTLNSSAAYRQKKIFVRLAPALMILTLFTGCFANYGKYTRSWDVTKMFESLQMPAEYKYYYAGSDKEPDALLGILRKYTLNNDLWKETEMDSKQLQRWLDEIELIGYSKLAYGYFILDPEGKPIGIYYSKWEGGPVKMVSGNQVVILLPDKHFGKRQLLLMQNGYE